MARDGMVAFAFEMCPVLIEAVGGSVRAVGVAWDYRSKSYLREITPTLLIASSGEFREDRYIPYDTPRTTAEYFVHNGRFSATLERYGTPRLQSFVLTRHDGLK